MTRITFSPKAQGFVSLLSDLVKKNVTSESIIQYAKYLALTMTLPVNPETLEITTQSDNRKTNVVEFGEVVIPRGVNLSTLTIESFFPNLGWTMGAVLGERTPPYIVKSVSSAFLGWTAEMYFTYFRILQMLRKPVSMLVISIDGTFVSLDVIVESITRRNVAGDNDLYYTLELTEYKKNSPTIFKPLLQTGAATGLAVIKNVVTEKNPSARIKTNFSVGDNVIVNGKYWYDSFGAKPFATFKDYTGKIDKITSNKQAIYKYHITDTNGGWKGWVQENQLRGVD